MKCPHCSNEIDGHRGRFSTDTTRTILDMFYAQKKSIYFIVKHLGEVQVKTNKMTIKKVVTSYENSWEDFLKRHAVAALAVEVQAQNQEEV